MIAIVERGCTFPIQAGSVHSVVVNQFVSLVFLHGRYHKKEQNIHRLGNMEWRNPRQNPLGQQYPQSYLSAPLSAALIPYRGQFHLVLSAPACQGAAVTQFGASWLEESLSLFWQALSDEDPCLNSG